MQDLPLRDIHWPDPVGFWPLAPGWWLIGLMVLLATVVGAVWLRHQARSITRLARMELTLLERRHDLAPTERCRRLSCLLRRVCLSLYPRETVAGLSGEAWLTFLDQCFDKPRFSVGTGRQLLEAPYNRHASLTTGDIDSLFKLSRDWLKLQPRRTP